MRSTLLILVSLIARDEAALREAFSKEMKGKEPGRRVEAVKKLSGAKEEKTIELLTHALKDAAKEVRKAAAETLESCADGAGVAVKPLGEILGDKKEDVELRVACAKALSKSPYKGGAFPHFYKAISTIEPEDRHLHKFGFEVTQILDKYVGKSFGAAKETPERWGEWWTDNKDALQKEDARRLEEYRKANPK